MSEREHISPGLQDAAEGGRAEGRPPFPERPYKFLDCFETADQPIFFGRDEEADALQNQIMAHKLTVLFGQSGVGKTSLIKAGVIPRLEEEGYTSLYLRVLREPAASIKNSLSPVLSIVEGQDATSPSSILHPPSTVGQRACPERSRRAPTEPLCSFLEATLPSESRLVVFLDQFEEFFVRLGKATRAAFAEELAACLKSEGVLRFVLSLRDDYLGRLHSLSAQLPDDPLINRFCLENLNVEKARLAVTQPAQAFKLRYEDELLETLLDDLEQEGDVKPPQLQIVCHKLYESLVDSGEWVEGSGRSGLFTLESYKELGGAEG
nr:hypothetical protein [Anaerolineae bacterium]